MELHECKLLKILFLEKLHESDLGVSGAQNIENWVSLERQSGVEMEFLYAAQNLLFEQAFIFTIQFHFC